MPSPAGLDGHSCSFDPHVVFREEDELVVFEECLEWVHIREFVEIFPKECLFEDTRVVYVELILILFILFVYG